MRDNKKRPGDVAAPLRAEDKRAYCETTPSVKQSTTPRAGGQRSIADYLSRGRESALTRRELERLTGLAPREVSLAVERERRLGTPILADGNGYFLPATDDERAACVRSLRHRAREIMTTARALELAGIDDGQLEIDAEGV